MDPRLLQLYNQELAYFREMGGEFARQFPKIAGRLGMEGIEVADPYVERLMEGVAFLAARVKLKLDAITDLPDGAGPINFVKDFGDTAALMLTVASPKVSDLEVELRAKACSGIRRFPTDT